jgi:hypothetical protein
MKYTTEQIEAIAAKLHDMPLVDKKKQEHSKQATIKMLAKEIHLLKKRGYTLDQISETLRGEGLDIATPTLKSYLQRAQAKGVTKTTRKTTAKATAETPEKARANTTIHSDGKTVGSPSRASFDIREDSAKLEAG